jgi:hypothetical protein
MFLKVHNTRKILIYFYYNKLFLQEAVNSAMLVENSTMKAERRKGRVAKNESRDKRLKSPKRGLRLLACVV